MSTGHPVSRRAFLGAVGVAVLAGCDAVPRSESPPGTTSSASTTLSSRNGPESRPTAVSNRTSGPAPSSTSARSTSGSSTAAPTTRKPAGERDLAALAQGLAGALVLPDDQRYAAASHLFNPSFDDVRPRAVAQCASAEDVTECVAFARRFDIPLAIRSGGHCYEGWSTGPGLVVDTGPLNSVRTEPGVAVVGAGTRLIDVYARLAEDKVGIPGGSCPTVGIAGLTLGGGIGVVDRMWGLACDNLSAVEVVTADGKVVTCTRSADPDLFWACQGGAGGTFGVVTSFTFRTRDIEPVATWGLSWPWSRAATVIDAWLAWVPTAPDELWGSVHLSSAPHSATPKVSVVGTAFGGDLDALDRALDGLISAVGAAPSSRYADAHSFLDAMLTDAGCGGDTVDECRLAPDGVIGRQAYAASSDWIYRPLSPAGTATLLHAIESRHDTAQAPDVAVQLDASGGAINRVDRAATAFVHRGAICSVQYIANWYDGTPAAVRTSAAAWPHQARTAMRPYLSGEAYQNYVDGRITDWPQAYFGDNYPRLQRVKAAYDPGNLFRHPQSVRA